MLKILFQKGFLYFILPFIALVLGGAGLLLFFEKGDILLAVNKISNKGLDTFFLFITDFGLGVFIAIAGILFSIYKIRWSLLLLTSLGLVGIFTNLFKKVFFPGLTRPLHYFLYDDLHRFIHEVPLIYFRTFPSGHTMAIFAFCSMLAYLARQKVLSILLFAIASIVAISRVYLLQHFFIDVYFGAILGLVSTFLAIWLIDKKLIKNKSFPDKGLVQLAFKRGGGE